MGWSVVEFDAGVLTARAPGGVMRITWHTGPRKAHPDDRQRAASVAPSRDADADATAKGDTATASYEAVPESSEWESPGVLGWSQ